MKSAQNYVSVWEKGAGTNSVRGVWKLDVGKKAIKEKHIDHLREEGSLVWENIQTGGKGPRCARLNRRDSYGRKKRGTQAEQRGCCRSPKEGKKNRTLAWEIKEDSDRKGGKEGR